MRHVITLLEMTSEEVRQILHLAAEIKHKFLLGEREALLPRRVMALLFEKPSLRTRVSFETGIRHLGGSSLFLGEDVGWTGGRESIQDFAQVLSSYVDVIVCRSKKHETVTSLAQYSSCPVINGLTDYSHPCQALADLLTIQELGGGLQYQKVAYVGDANNVSRSLATICAQLGIPFSIAAPKGYQFEDGFMDTLRKLTSSAEIVETDDPYAAVKGATAVYTDVWTSMGQEAETQIRLKAFKDYQVDSKLMAHAQKDACFLHCLPARRGEEVSADVIDGPQSAVIRQAENRMHAQKGLLAWLLTDPANSRK